MAKKLSKEAIDSLVDKTEELQLEMHAFIDERLPKARRDTGKNILYDDMRIVYLLLKIAQIQDELSRISLLVSKSG
jgi:hypothetical protein